MIRNWIGSRLLRVLKIRKILLGKDVSQRVVSKLISKRLDWEIRQLSTVSCWTRKVSVIIYHKKMQGLGYTFLSFALSYFSMFEAKKKAISTL